ncbi:MAG: hypothetical protein AB2A00_27310 [Myxococcota bacterium]
MDENEDRPEPKAKKGKAKDKDAGEAKGLDPIDDLTANWEDPETKELRTKELAKEVLSKGAWATVMFLVQDLDRKTKGYRAPKISVRRYKKSGGTYRYQSSFNISSEKQAGEMMKILNKWFAKDGVGRKAVDEFKASGGSEESED